MGARGTGAAPKSAGTRDGRLLCPPCLTSLGGRGSTERPKTGHRNWPSSGELPTSPVTLPKHHQLQEPLPPGPYPPPHPPCSSCRKHPQRTPHLEPCPSPTPHHVAASGQLLRGTEGCDVLATQGGALNRTPPAHSEVGIEAAASLLPPFSYITGSCHHRF